MYPRISTLAYASLPCTGTQICVPGADHILGGLRDVSSAAQSPLGLALPLLPDLLWPLSWSPGLLSCLWGAAVRWSREALSSLEGRWGTSGPSSPGGGRIRVHGESCPGVVEPTFLLRGWAALRGEQKAQAGGDGKGAALGPPSCVWVGVCWAGSVAWGGPLTEEEGREAWLDVEALRVRPK